MGLNNNMEEENLILKTNTSNAGTLLNTKVYK